MYLYCILKCDRIHMLVKAFNNAYAYDAMSIALKEKLIDLVEMNPGLWRQSRKAPGLKQKIWDEIGAELGTTGYDARRQWEILRDQQRRENKRYKQDPNYKSKWMFYSKMLFTLTNNAPVAAFSDEGENCQTGHQLQNDIFHYQTPKIEEEHSIIQVRRDLKEGNDSFNHLRVPSVDGDEYSQAAATITTAAVPTIVEDYYPSISAGVSSSTQLPRNTEDVDLRAANPSRNKRYSNYPEDEEDYYFAMSLVPSLRCIPRPKKLRVRSKILDLIAEALEEDYLEENNMSSKDDHEIEEKIIPDHMLHTSMEKSD